MTSPSKQERGFSLIEILMAIALIGVLAVVSITVLTPNLDESRFQATLQRMRKIQVALVGDPSLAENRVRTSFGYLGDVGSLPTAAQGLTALATNPSLPAYAANSTARIGLGWNGPYLSAENSANDYLVDAWGTAYVYSPTANPPTLVSLGADRAVGGTGLNQDITISLPPEQRLAVVTGFLCTTGAPFTAAAQVELNYPDGSGGLTQSLVTLTAADAGKFSFANIPFGVRSLTVYQPSKASPTQTVGPVVLTIDKPNVLVPCNAIDFNP